MISTLHRFHTDPGFHALITILYRVRAASPSSTRLTEAEMVQVMDGLFPEGTVIEWPDGTRIEMASGDAGMFGHQERIPPTPSPHGRMLI